jgi:hypothetical protein
MELNIARRTKNKWSIIQETPEAIEKLRSMIHSKGLLERSGYKLEPLTEESISDQRKCVNCHGWYYHHLQLSEIKSDQFSS